MCSMNIILHENINKILILTEQVLRQIYRNIHFSILVEKKLWYHG